LHVPLTPVREPRVNRLLSVLSVFAVAVNSANLPAQSTRISTEPGFFNEMRWRDIGPYRGGRTKASAGVPQQPNVFYIGVVNGGGWKTTACRGSVGRTFGN